MNSLDVVCWLAGLDDDDYADVISRAESLRRYWASVSSQDNEHCVR
jgi:hypothetical protein